ncbi:MAG: tetratricopeptide repeat protein [Acidobacteria bacterium]|nr:tetratricopeptide repeat protein [Acidobacteriota bacterium]
MKKVISPFILVSLILSAITDLRAALIASKRTGKYPPQTTSRPAQTPPSTPAQSQAKSTEPRQREQAYLRYLEAQRLKGEAQREAQRMRSKGLFDDAIRAYKETIQLDPASAEPHVDLGEIYFFYLNRSDQAEREGLEAVRIDPSNLGGHLLLGRLYVSFAKRENNPRSIYLDQAIREYEKVAEIDPSHAEAWALLAELYQVKNDTERQISALEKWAGAPVPNDTFFYRWLMNTELSSDQAYFQLSQLYLSQGKNQQAVDAARRAYESNPESNTHVRNLISILRTAGTSVDELRVYSQLVRSVASPALLIGYGSALVRAGQYVEAVERLREYVKLDPSNASAVGLLAVAQRRANDRQAAIVTLRAALTNVDANMRTDLLIELAETYEELGRDEEAITLYEQAFESFLGKGALTPVNTPLFGEVVNRLVRACRRVGNQSRLQSVLTRTRRVIDEQNSILELIAIESLREDGKRREALDLTQAAIRRHREDRGLKFTEAIILNEMKRFKESAELLREMIKGTAENATDDASVYMLLSSVQMQSGELKAAEESARKAIELNPDDGDALIQLSSVLDRAERYDESEKILRGLIKRDQDNATALNNLGYFLIERGERYEEALKLIEQAIAIEPINGSFLDSLGWAHFKLGNFEKAREKLEKAMIYSRRNSTVHEHLGDVLREQGKEAEARRHWEKALEYSVEDDEIARIKVKLKDAR